VQTYETNTPGPDGKPIWFSSRIGPLRRDGAVVGAVLVSQDITEMKQAQVELLAARRLASLGTLAAGVAHEINTPVQFVGDSLQFLRSSTRDLLHLIEKLQTLRADVLAGAPVAPAVAAAAAAEADADLPYLRENLSPAFDRCQDGLARVATIVRSLKDFAHPSGKEMAAVDLQQAIESTLTIAAHEYKYVADVFTALEKVPLVVCHAGELNQALLELVLEAARSAASVKPRGRIEVSTRVEAASVVVQIGAQSLRRPVPPGHSRVA
jgi:C4-dicarboxylate-specific signal transduction histidine kinase